MWWIGAWRLGFLHWQQMLSIVGWVGLGLFSLVWRDHLLYFFSRKCLADPEVWKTVIYLLVGLSEGKNGVQLRKQLVKQLKHSHRTFPWENCKPGCATQPWCFLFCHTKYYNEVGVRVRIKLIFFTVPSRAFLSNSGVFCPFTVSSQGWRLHG